MGRFKPQPEQTEEEQARADLGRQYAEASALSLRNYLKHVRIDGSRGPVKFGTAMEEWQRESNYPIIDALDAVGGSVKGYTGPHCFWRDLPQGHDKTSGIARLLNGILAFSRKPLEIGCFARDTEQANRIWKFMKAEAQLNPWIGERLQFIEKRVRSVRKLAGDHMVGGGELTIYDAEFEGNAGHKLDVCVCEELTWWPEKAKQLYDQLYSRRHKIEHSVFIVLGNSGITRTWQHREYKAAQADPNWHVYRTEGTVASWIDKAQLERDMKRVIPSVARRVYGNEWIDEHEQTYLTRAELDGCVHKARQMHLRSLTEAEPGIKYIGSVDYAPTQNMCAMCIQGQYPDGTNRVVRLDVLQAHDFPPPNGAGVPRIPLKVVRAWMEKQHLAFRNPAWIVDKYQLEEIIQDYEYRWQIHRFDYRGGMSNYAMAEHVRTVVINGQLLWPEFIGAIKIVDESGEEVVYTLADEFHDLVTKDMPYGYRWDHKANRNDDRATAVGMGAYWSMKIDPSQPFPTTGVVPDLTRSVPLTPKTVIAPVGKHSIWGGKD